MKNKRILLIALAVILVAVAVWLLFLRTPAGIRIQTVKILQTMPHDEQAFTEGLFYQDGYFFESTGEEGASGFRKVKPETGAIVQQSELPPLYFGEGIVGWGDKIYQLTWKGLRAEGRVRL